MIVKMKKVIMVVLENEIRKSMHKLRDAGLMHLNVSVTENTETGELREKKDKLEKAYDILGEPGISSSEIPSCGTDAVMQAAENIIKIKEKITNLTEEMHKVERDIQRLLPWGDFNGNDLAYLNEHNIKIMLFELTADQVNNFPENINTYVISKNKTQTRIAAVFPKDYIMKDFTFEQVSLPDLSLSEAESLRAQKKDEIESAAKELANFYIYRQQIAHAKKEIDNSLEFAFAAGSMNKEGIIAHISGYIPARDAGKLNELASENNWGIMITDPADDEAVPTLIENPKWIRAISPVFNLLGTIPGYKEFDISIWFLIFFSIFWAMIVGDAGYGFLFLLFSIVGRIKFRKAPFEPFLLLFITSVTTIIWGGITGNWFGAEAIVKSRIVSWMVIPSLASFSVEGSSDVMIMKICFLLGAVHLTIAHLMGFIRLFPSLKSLAEIGRLSLVWSMYMLIRKLILKAELPSFVVWMLAGGLVFIILFSEQNGKFFKGVAASLKNFIVIAINSIGFFSDVVSYVRLFAVGLASFAIAKSFNEMALSLGSGVLAVAGTVLILFFAHSLNIVLSMMSLIVHGVRLNLLEFSGHLNIEWSGFEYKPFKKEH